jgi:hypothetical protein
MISAVRISRSDVKLPDSRRRATGASGADDRVWGWRRWLGPAGPAVPSECGGRHGRRCSNSVLPQGHVRSTEPDGWSGVSLEDAVHYGVLVAEVEKPYNPLDRVELGRSIVRALLAKRLNPLPPAQRFQGAGLYAIYYCGPLPLYAPIAQLPGGEGDMPIYVGRARPRGARKGLVQSLEATTTDPVLWERLREHAESIESVERYFQSQREPGGLRLADFRCRHLVVDDFWVPLAEALLIAHYRPVWNVVVSGFGIHDPGKGRLDQKRSDWDQLHPGREFAFRLANAKRTPEDIEVRVRQHLAELPSRSIDEVPVIDDSVREALRAEESEDGSDA